MNRVKPFTGYKLAITTLLALLLFALTSNAYAADEIQEHINISSHPENCMDSGCHAGIHLRETLDPNIPDAHAVMLGEAPGEDEEKGEKKCAWCHTKVDLVQAAGSPAHTTENLRKRVDVRLCVLCHGRLPPEQGPPWISDPDKHKPFYQVTFAELDPPPNGTELYEMACSGCHKPLQNTELRGKPASKIADVIREDKGGMGKLSVLTSGQIGAIAGALAEGGDDDSDDD